ncbi:MAG: Flp pilus assembly protein CpaB [Rhizobiaceae bacterium]
MNPRALIMSLIGICVAGGSVFATMGKLEKPTPTASELPQLVQLIAARHDIKFGEKISFEMLATQAWPADTVPENAFSELSNLIGPPGSKPRRAREIIRKGELLLPSNVSEFGETVTIVKVLGSNSRAMSIWVDAVTAVGGFVTPGDHVDIVLTEGKGAGLRAATILQDVRVLGVDQNTDRGNRGRPEARTITVEVAPREGQILALAQRAGTLSLTLRTERDVANEELEQITLDDLLRDSEPVFEEPIAKPVAAPPRTIKVRRGTATEVVGVE